MSDHTFRVVSPLGQKDVGPGWTPHEPVPSLSGKTVCEIWDLVYRGDIMFEVFREEFRSRYPGVKFVGYSEFGNIHGATEKEVIASLPRLLEEFGCDAAIVGVGS